MQKQFLANISQYIKDPGVELIGVINKRGMMTEFVGTNNIPLSDSKKEMFFMKIALRTSCKFARIRTGKNNQ